jgi:hypothetical protein
MSILASVALGAVCGAVSALVLLWSMPSPCPWCGGRACAWYPCTVAKALSSAELARLQVRFACGHRKADWDDSYGGCAFCAIKALADEADQVDPTSPSLHLSSPGGEQ